MAFHVGYGGKVSKVATPVVDLCISKWSAKMGRERVELITSCGRTLLASRPNHSGTIEVPYDDAQTLQSLDMEEGDTVTVRLYLGDSGHYLQGSVFIESVDYSVDNSQGAVMQVLNWIANVSIGSAAFTYV